jgi:Putative zinc-finger
MKQDSEKIFQALLKRQLRDDFAAAKVSTECPDENVVSAYLEHTLAEDLRTDFERHASMCARCQEELALLVKSQGAAPASAVTQPVSAAKSGWLATLQAAGIWFSNAGPKPVLGVLVVMLISGYVGVELYQREWQGRQSATDMAHTIPQDRKVTETDNHEGSVLEVENGTGETRPVPPSTPKEKLKANQEGYLTGARRVVGGDAPAARPSDGLSKDASREKLLRDTYSPVRTESSAKDKTPRFESSQSESLARQPTMAGLPETPSPEPSSTVVRSDNTAAKAPERQLPASKKTAVTTLAGTESRRALVQDQRAAPDEDHVNTNGRDKEDFLKRQANANDLSASRATTGKLKEEASINPKVEASGERRGREPLRLRAAAKTFELRNDVWTDLSIKEGEAGQVDLTIYKDSSDYQQQVKPLSAYNSVLSRHEDCLVEHEGKIYFVKSSH